MQRTFEALEKSHNKYKEYIEKLEEKLSGKVEFEFSIVNLESDGHCIVNIDTTDVMKLDVCLERIEEEGFLSEEYHAINSF